MSAARSPAPTGALRLVKSPRHDFSALRRMARHDSDLTTGARLLFEDVCELAERGGVCAAGRHHFEEAFGASARTVRGWIAELRGRGYVAPVEAEEDGRTYRLRPALPGENYRQESAAISPNKRQIPAATLGDSGRNLPEIAADFCRAPIDSIPREGGEGACAPEAEETAVSIYESVTGLSLHLYFAEKVAAVVGSSPTRLEAWRETCLVWTATHAEGYEGRRYNLGNIPDMLAAFEEALAPRGGRNGKPPAFTLDRRKLAGPLSDDDRTAALADAALGLDAADFYQLPGADARGRAEWRLRPDVRERLGLHAAPAPR